MMNALRVATCDKEEQNIWYSTNFIFEKATYKITIFTTCHL